ncbi:MAG: hypothetical protein U1F41_12860 [Burkholderiales bacterium]
MRPIPTPRARESDRFRDTSFRWRVDSGTLAGTVLDIHVHADGSVEWRVVAGPSQGRVGRSRDLARVWLGQTVASLWLPLAHDALSVTVDVAARRFAGFVIEGTHATPVSGTLHDL